MPLGTENLKKAVKLAIDLGEQFATATTDGWQWTDSFGFLDELAAIPGVVKSGKDIAAEIADLSAEERAEIYSFVESEFNIENDKVEAIVEAALRTAISILGLVEKIKVSKAA